MRHWPAMFGKSAPLLLLLLLLSLLCCASAAATTRRVGLLPIETMNVEPGEARQAEAALATIVARRGFSSAPRAAVQRALHGRPAECRRQVPCLRTVGRALGVDTLLVLRAVRLGDTLAVQLSAFDVQRGVRQGTWEELLRAPGEQPIAAALGRMLTSFAPPPPAPPPPWYRRWWVWTAVGVAVAGAAVAIAVGARDGRPTPDLVITPP